MLDLATAVLAISVHVDSALRTVATPTPSPAPEFDETIVTPGPAGFIVIFAIALLTVLLILDMVRRVRRVRLRDGLATEARMANELRVGGDGRASGDGQASGDGRGAGDSKAP
ncbi:hypothetical protein [Naasia lichenicola]|uniref:hypothetical protein n=1 Tax=Naasia lichenicola TaxID=2565933 RepID=UPI0018EE8ED7|nr:hypothetical protein [Naasia lichenicola]